MKRQDSIKLNIVQLDQFGTYPDEDELPKDGLYRYLYQPGKKYEDRKRQAADFIWSKKRY